MSHHPLYTAKGRFVQSAHRISGTRWTAPGIGPAEIWRRDLGPGYSAIVVEGGRLFTMYRDGNDEIVAA